MMEMASNGHFLTQMPQPMHRVSDSLAICGALMNGVFLVHLEEPKTNEGSATRFNDM